jgi:hypothetical protein
MPTLTELAGYFFALVFFADFWTAVFLGERPDFGAGPGGID